MSQIRTSAVLPSTPTEQRVPTAPTTRAVYGTATPPDGYEIVSDSPIHLIGAVDGVEMRLQERDGGLWLICHDRNLYKPVPFDRLFAVLRKYPQGPDTAVMRATVDTCAKAEVTA
uniref:Uncharacterized protein n=1 Tax=Streptomyces sp. NBC_00093 TaxID=2975649 RepID=A0AAU2A1G5_9ACTN